jgi:hypothetical protein
MRRILLFLALAALALSSSCDGQGRKQEAAGSPLYTEIVRPQVDLRDFPKDAEGFRVLFDGTSFKGWRGYCQDGIPVKWTIEDGCLKFNGTTGRETPDDGGGDLIFDRKFRDFELRFDWKVTEGANSGVLYLGREVTTAGRDGQSRFAPLFMSAPEYQILDNENHPDAKLGVDGNRRSASLYDILPARPQNAKPFGEWNTGAIRVRKGRVTHFQNGEPVVEYRLWTQDWTDLLNGSKFAQERWPVAFELFNNLGGDAHEGYIGFQDHGDVVYFRNIRIKVWK